MRPSPRLFASTALIFPLIFLGSLASQAQVVDAAHPSASIDATHPRASIDATHLGDSINLSGSWAFQPGDDLRWSRPDFDDSHWRIISTQESWQDQAVSRPRDFFWYRLRVRLPVQHAPLSLLFNYSAFPYEVYVNGVLVGRYGQLPPHEKVDGPLIRAFEIPPAGCRRGPHHCYSLLMLVAMGIAVYMGRNRGRARSCARYYSLHQ